LRRADEFELLLQLGCGYAEGRFIAEPRGADGLAAWDARWRPPSADGG